MDALALRDRILDGKYRVTRLIAEGGMGVVVEAVHLALEHNVALKFPLVPAGIDEQEARGRLLREARAAAALKGEHVCRIFDVCELPSGEPYLVMELLEGADLGARLDKAMSVREAAELVRQACLGVAEAHAHGIVHRDLKPENLFVSKSHLGLPLVKVLDFGISKMPAERRRDRVGVVTRDAMGSPLYMSPEQMLSTSDVDARADVWSLGVILYELVAGVAPFDGESVPQICVKVMREPPRWLGDVRPDLPEAFVALVHRCLEKDPARRVASATELGEELAAFSSVPRRSSSTDRGRRPSSPSMAPSSREASHATGVAWTDMPAPRRRARRLASVAFVALALGLGAAAALRGPGLIDAATPAAAIPAPAWEPEGPPPAPSFVAAPAPTATLAEAPPIDTPVVTPSASASTSASAVAIAPPKPRPRRDLVAPPDFTAGPNVIDTSRRDLYEPAPTHPGEADSAHD